MMDVTVLCSDRGDGCDVIGMRLSVCGQKYWLKRLTLLPTTMKMDAICAK
jgi:hypothetical protein